ncbi:MAG: hypothetical protein Ct9H90mP7_3930 [Candidatus Neomarinimicrobiota bacterium]|nr:MAG: hypothetical protein Ct9H90mP7_3930 [Candidatus Neomarinimicrobiota bacterium]
MQQLITLGTRLSIETIRSELKFKVNDDVVGELRVAVGEHDRFQIYDGDGDFNIPTHPAYGFFRNNADSMMMNWNALEVILEVYLVISRVWGAKS